MLSKRFRKTDLICFGIDKLSITFVVVKLQSEQDFIFPHPKEKNLTNDNKKNIWHVQSPKRGKLGYSLITAAEHV